jgi:hypothetical protein
MAIPGFSQAAVDAAVKPLLVEPCHVLTRTETDNGIGGQSVVYVRGPELHCALGPAGGGEGVSNPGDRIDDRTTDFIVLPAGTSVTERDQVETANHGRYEVIAVNRRSIELGRELHVIVATGDIEIEEGEGEGEG